MDFQGRPMCLKLCIGLIKIMDSAQIAQFGEPLKHPPIGSLSLGRGLG